MCCLFSEYRCCSDTVVLPDRTLQASNFTCNVRVSISVTVRVSVRVRAGTDNSLSVLVCWCVRVFMLLTEEQRVKNDGTVRTVHLILYTGFWDVFHLIQCFKTPLIIYNRKCVLRHPVVTGGAFGMHSKLRQGHLGSTRHAFDASRAHPSSVAWYH